MARPHMRSSRDSRWLSNSFLVWDRPGGKAVLIDSGAPRGPLQQTLEEERLSLEAVLCTHHHGDHVHYNQAWAADHGCVVCAHPAEFPLVPGASRPLEHGEEFSVGTLTVRALHVPGHTLGQLSFLVNGSDLFTGDTLFRGSVGGTRAPGHGTIEQLRESILCTLLSLPDQVRVHPGHMDSTTLGEERRTNPFVRTWTGAERPKPRPCLALGEEATLMLLARDYDGGTKGWVRFANGREDVVAGSRIQEL